MCIRDRPGGEEAERDTGGFFEGEVVGDADCTVLRGCEEFGVAAIAGIAEHGIAAAQVVVAGETGLALAATQSRREQHAPARLDALAQRPHLDDFARDVAAQYMRQGEFHAGNAGAYEEVEVVQGASAHADQDFVGLDGGFRGLFVDKRFRAAVLMNASEVHSCQFTVTLQLWMSERWFAH